MGEAAEKIRERIEGGRLISDSTIRTDDDLKRARAEQEKWHDYNSQLLTSLFDNQSIAKAYEKSSLDRSTWPVFDLGPKVQRFREGMQNRINKLDSILGRLKLMEVGQAKLAGPTSADANLPTAKKIFLVHGQDKEVKETVARFIHVLGLEPVILEEQPSAGKTIIER